MGQDTTRYETAGHYLNSNVEIGVFADPPSYQPTEVDKCLYGTEVATYLARLHVLIVLSHVLDTEGPM